VPAIPASESSSTDPGPLRPVLVLALDGATFDVIEPMVAAGELPNLAAWMEGGQHAPLPSTIPPVTFPAWSSFMTGLEPAEHGIFDFTQKREGQYRLRFVNATDRAAPSIWKRVSDAGGEVLVLGMPATHPPEDVRGLLVCGFDAPVSTGTDERSASDPLLYRAIADEVGPWMRPELDETAKADDFHERAIETLLSRIDRKCDFALEALAQMKARSGGALPALTMVVFSESDTAGHHYFRDHDPDSPRHDPEIGPARREALRDVYRRLDDACGELRAAAPEALCVVVSDHGMGTATDKVVHLNRHLAERGLLFRREGLGRFVDGLARRARDLALAWLPAGLAQALFRRARAAAAELESRARFGGIDWRRTVAFSEEANTNPGVWINLAGREARGCVAPEEYERVRNSVIDALLDWKLPSGAPVVRRALKREEVHRGPFADRAPDILVELALEDGHGLSLVPTPWSEGGRHGAGIPSVRVLDADDHGGGRGRGMNGTHRANGIWIAERCEGSTPADPPARLSAVAPWLAYAMGLAWDDATAAGPEADANGPRPQAYGPDEEDMVAERLRALGYLD
jgi:predicted AlkP superfamily phosphohydrolase/phosphomutase